MRRRSLEYIFDNLDEQVDALEQEANQIAGTMLIPENIWETALARYVQTEESVRTLANELRINHAIVAGKIRMEADNYYILGNLIGQGEVRKHFPDVQFA